MSHPDTDPKQLLNRAYGRTHYWRNRDRIRQAQRAYASRLVAEGNPVRLRRKKRYYKRNRQAILDAKRASDRAWREKHPDYFREWSKRRHTLITWAIFQTLRFSKNILFHVESNVPKPKNSAEGKRL